MVVLKVYRSQEKSTQQGDDVYEIVLVLIRDHKTEDGEADPIDLAVLFDHNTFCEQSFMQWLERTAAEEAS